MCLRFVNILIVVVAAALIVAVPSAAAAHPERSAPVRLTVAPSAFSPNGDGRLDETEITVATDQPATVTVEVVDPNGTPIRAWTQPVAPGVPVTITWDGTVEGKRVPDGSYVVRGRGETPLDPVEEAQVPVTIDTRAPEAGWKGTSPVLTTQDQVAFEFRAADSSSPLHVRLEIEDRHGVVGATEEDVRPGQGRIEWRARGANGRELLPGTYFASLVVRDGAGNLARLNRAAWRVHTPSRARVVRNVPGAGRQVALTIDDCHFPRAWSRMLRTLRKRKASATFFCPGKQILANPALVRRTIRDGHEIGAHAWDHALLTRLSEAQVTERLRKDADALWRVAQRTTAPYFRPPYGAFDRTVVTAAGRTAHPRVVMWDVDTQDWQRPGVATITHRAIRQSQRGSIVLLHTLDQSAAALPAIITGLRKRGLEPVGLAELFGAGRSRTPSRGHLARART